MENSPDNFLKTTSDGKAFFISSIRAFKILGCHLSFSTAMD